MLTIVFWLLLSCLSMDSAHPSEKYYSTMDLPMTSSLDLSREVESQSIELPQTNESPQDLGSQEDEINTTQRTPLTEDTQGINYSQSKTIEETTEENYLQAIEEVFGQQAAYNQNGKTLYPRVKLSPSVKAKKLKLHLPKVGNPLRLLKIRQTLRRNLVPKRHPLRSGSAILGSSMNEPLQEEKEESAEMLTDILESNIKDENPFHGAVLTKLITYNITKLQGKEFLLEKKEDISANVNYLDSSERLTNYSDAHSSSMKTIVSENDFNIFESILNTDVEQNSINKHEPRNQYNSNNKVDENSFLTSPYLAGGHGSTSDFVGGSFIAKSLPNGQILHGKQSIKKESHSDAIKSQLDNQNVGNKNDRINPNEFVGGQYIETDPPSIKDTTIQLDEKSKTLSNPDERHIPEDEGIFETLSILGEPNPKFQTDVTPVDEDYVTNSENKLTKSTSQHISPSLETRDDSLKLISTNDALQSVEVFSSNPKVQGPLFYSYENSVDDSLGVTKAVDPDETTSNFGSDQKDEILESTNGLPQGGILETDRVTGELVRELVADHLQGRTEKINSIQDILKGGEIASDSPAEVGEYTEIMPNIVESSKPVSEHPVELFAGTPPIHENTASKFSLDIKKPPSNFEIFINDENVTELCFPLGGDHNMSLYDLLSGSLFFENNGKRVSFTLREHSLKNCTSGSKTCKLYFDSRPEVSSKKKTNVEKRHISDDELRRVTLNLEKTLVQPKNEENEETIYNFYEANLNHQLNDPPESYPFVIQQSTNLKKTKIPKEDNLNPILQEDYDMTQLNYAEDTSVNSQKDISSGTSASAPYFWIRRNKNRPTRTAKHVAEEEPKKEDCACSSSNDILQNALLSTPSYHHFVGKRLDILKNIVHTVSDWVADSNK